MIKVVAMAGGAMEQVKEGDQGFTFFNAEEKVPDSLTEDSIEHVFDVEEKEGPGWGDTKVAADLDTSRMDDTVKAAFDGCAKLKWAPSGSMMHLPAMRR